MNTFQNYIYDFTNKSILIHFVMTIKKLFYKMLGIAKTVVQKHISVHPEHGTQARKSYFLIFFQQLITSSF